MKTVQRIIDLFGGLKALCENPLKIETSGFMPLCIERIGTGPRDLPLVSVAHYFEQNGDLMRDPDMTFEIDSKGIWHPVSFQQDPMFYQEAVFRNASGQAVIREGLVDDLSTFSESWDRNLGHQGYVESAEAAARA